jgi:hypothetical protein
MMAGRTAPTGSPQPAAGEQAPGPTGFIELDSDWGLWPVAGLRSAGLPAMRIDHLVEDPAAEIMQTACDPWFQEALAWQNRSMLQTWLADYAERLEAGDTRLHRRGYRFGVIARYLQRYATKNDTIGFFGPIGWARIEPDHPELVTARGSGRIQRRSHFESRPMRVLARRWDQDPALRDHLPPRRDPSARLCTGRLVRPRRSPLSLSAEEQAVLEYCDGSNTPAQILHRLNGDRPDLEFSSLLEIRSVLARLAHRGAVQWGLRLPFDERAEHHLRRQLLAVPREAADRYLAALDLLTTARAAVDAAAGHPVRLAAALAALDARFEALAGLAVGDIQPSPSGRATMRTGRGLVWLDSVADWQVTLGSPAVGTLGPPLCLLLCACRWLTWRVATGIERVARALVSQAAGARKSFAHLLTELAPELAGAVPGGVRDEAVAAMRDRISRLVDPPPQSRVHTVASSELSAPWQEAFAAPGPGWAAAAFHSPDVMLAADDCAVPSYRWVVGEVHVGVNTLDNRAFVVNQQQPGEIERLVAASSAVTRYVPAFPEQWPDVSPRTYPPLSVDVPGVFRYWSIEADDVLPSALARIPCAQLHVEVRGTVLVVVDGDRVIAPFTEFVGELLSFLVGNTFEPFGSVPHTPRVVIDDVVIWRETWQFAPDALVTGTGRAAADHLVGALRGAGVPDQVFVRVPSDRKPFYCDLRSPILVQNLVRMLGRADAAAGSVRIQEVLPAFDRLWLRGPGGDRHTSEFRMVAVDRRPSG